jgi:hypothetical protein
MSAANCPEVQQQLLVIRRAMDRMLQALDVDPDAPPEPVAVHFDHAALDALLTPNT